MPEMSTSPTLEVKALALRRGVTQLGPISFSLPHAGCWWLTGTSGAGKSLLLESVAGFHAEAEGSVVVNGLAVESLAPEHRSICLMPQRWRLFPHWTVARNLHFAASLSQCSATRIDELAQRLQVQHLLHRPTRALSGGETQRIVLIQTLLSPARVLLLDEPLSAIDAALQSAVIRLLQEEIAAGQRICLIAAHRAAGGHPMQGELCIGGGQLLLCTKSVQFNEITPANGEERRQRLV
jgi:molybdate/tungstate transport system ATP-binding protein